MPAADRGASPAPTARRLTDAREDERRRVAAHLHDSVLQTLALVQRQAHDPAAVARLARRQEHELRAWMAGEVELGAETLGAALRAAVAEVEDDYDATVELTLLGERRAGPRRPRRWPPPRARRCATPRGTRRARRSSSSPRPSPDGAEVFVRDEGPGFDLADGADRAARRARLDRRAGWRRSAARRTVESRPGEGTEIALRIGVVMRIVVVDDHHLFRAGVRAELAAHHEVVGEAATPAEAVAVIAETKPDVVLLDVHLPDGGGVAVLEALRGGRPEGARAVASPTPPRTSCR